MTVSMEARERAEIDFWRTSPEESLEADSIGVIIDKTKDAQIFMALLERYRNLFPTRGRFLELGAGHGWASCLLKRLRPEAHVVATDISPYALESHHKWERIWGHRADTTYACNSYATQELDASVDTAFCFAAAHHFSNHGRTMHELARILKPKGHAIYFYEPTTSELFYGPAFKRVNAKRPAVPEDLLVPRRLRAYAAAAGLSIDIHYYPSTLKRGSVALLYYKVLSALPMFQRILPCTANVVIRRAST